VNASIGAVRTFSPTTRFQCHSDAGPDDARDKKCCVWLYGLVLSKGTFQIELVEQIKQIAVGFILGAPQ
jgi:hypothetical protein